MHNLFPQITFCGKFHILLSLSILRKIPHKVFQIQFRFVIRNLEKKRKKRVQKKSIFVFKMNANMLFVNVLQLAEVAD